ncbi:MAG: 4Fe-4S double cluster binding domain-containing protein [Christensenellales bacterium]
MMAAMAEAFQGMLWGVADMAGHPLAGEYPSAVAVAAPHASALTLADYQQARMTELIDGAKARVEAALDRVEALAQARGVACWRPPLSQRSESELRAPVSFKEAAVRAGLGWRGHSDLLVTPQYGPRVRLGLILLGERLPAGEPVTRSGCPEGCRACVRACPYGAIIGPRWQPGQPRETRIHIHQCNDNRSAYRHALGRKHSCGLCMAACPFGSRRGV